MSHLNLLEHISGDKRDHLGLFHVPKFRRREALRWDTGEVEDDYERRRKSVENFNSVDKELQRSVEKLRPVLEVIRFLHQRLFSAMDLPAIDLPACISNFALGVIRPYVPTAYEELKTLERRMIQAESTKRSLLTAVDRVFQYRLHDTLFVLREPSDSSSFSGCGNNYLLRLCTPASNCKLQEDIGILCSGWLESHITLKSFEEFKEEDTALTQVKNHCEDKKETNCFISSINSVLWLLENLTKYCSRRQVKEEDCCIAVINMSSMEKLGIVTERSDLLVNQLEGEKWSPSQDTSRSVCVSYAWENHYLTYLWIPECCIVKKLRVEEFRDRARKAGVISGAWIQETLLVVVTNGSLSEASIDVPTHCLLKDEIPEDEGITSLTTKLGGTSLTV